MGLTVLCVVSALAALLLLSIAMLAKGGPKKP